MATPIANSIDRLNGVAGVREHLRHDVRGRAPATSRHRPAQAQEQTGDRQHGDQHHRLRPMRCRMPRWRFRAWRWVRRNRFCGRESSEGADYLCGLVIRGNSRASSTHSWPVGSVDRHRCAMTSSPAYEWRSMRSTGLPPSLCHALPESAATASITSSPQSAGGESGLRWRRPSRSRFVGEPGTGRSGSRAARPPSVCRRRTETLEIDQRAAASVPGSRTSCRVAATRLDVSTVRLGTMPRRVISSLNG